jgi:hypothetical protein
MLITLVDEPAVVTFRIAAAECVTDPLVPVIVIVELPVVAPVVILSVEVPEVVIAGGEKLNVDPAGTPPADKLAVPVNPLSAATVTVYVAVPPGGTDVVPGETLMLKSGATTLSTAVAECVAELLVVPVIDTVEVLAELPAAVETVSVEEPDPLMEDGEKEGVAPVGNPLAVRFTESVNPFTAETVTVYVVLLPALTL